MARDVALVEEQARWCELKLGVNVHAEGAGYHSRIVVNIWSLV